MLAAFLKSWFILPNVAVAATGTAATTQKAAMYALFGDTGAMVGGNGNTWYDQTGAVAVPANAPVVRRTCNGSAVSTLGQTNLTNSASFVCANPPNPHSWGVWDFPTVESEVLVSCNSASANLLMIKVAPYGITGSRFGDLAAGTTTSDPTATNSYTVNNLASWGGANNTDTQVRLHCWLSTDGKVVMIVTCVGGETNGLFVFGEPNSFDAAWLKPFVGLNVATTAVSNAVSLSLMNDSSPIKGYANGALSMALATMTSRSVRAPSVTKANGVSGKWGQFPQALDSGDASNDGYHGELFDVRWGALPPALPSGRITTAQVAPALAQGAWWKFGGLWLPGVPGLDAEVS